VTEAEWLACENPRAMFDYLSGKEPSDRKLRLCACGCCRLIPEFMESNPDLAGLELTERDVDAALGADAFDDIDEQWDIRWYRRDGWNALARAIGSYREAAGDRGRSSELNEEVHDLERVRRESKLAELIRCIFGNPFQPVAVDPAWLTSTVVALARGIYDDRAFDRMPILADALQDSGCDNDDVLNHCRDEKATHVRGCWVVDLVLGKQ
jgi:hypothetical protein